MAGLLTRPLRDRRLLVALGALAVGVGALVVTVVPDEGTMYDLAATRGCLEHSGHAVAYFDDRQHGGVQGLTIGPQDDPELTLFFARDADQAQRYHEGSSEIGGAKGNLYYEGAPLADDVDDCLIPAS